MADKHLILGGSGFVGRHVAQLLATRGDDVTLADRVPPPDSIGEGTPGRVDWRAFDLASADWEALIEGVDVIHHYAWTSIPATANADPGSDLQANVLPTIGLLDAICARPADSRPRLLFSSSGGTVYGRLQRAPVDEDHPLRPLNGYGAGKAAAELYLTTYRALHGLDCRIARLSNPYGAGQNLARGQGAVTTFLHRALNNEPIAIWGDGEVIRDYIHIADAAAGLVALAGAPDPGASHVFNIGSGHGTSLNAILAELGERLNRRLDVRYELARPYDVPVNILDITLAQTTFGWSPKLSFSEGIKRTLEDLADGRMLSSL